ncbi:hypothetical protein HMPREF9533_02296 [Escherichia coli MS 60-1]|nr:hypothetical protein HMPREF9533_02296 [Escherichia coli MS 60-1]
MSLVRLKGNTHRQYKVILLTGQRRRDYQDDASRVSKKSRIFPDSLSV